MYMDSIIIVSVLLGLKLSQLILPAVRGTGNDEMISHEVNTILHIYLMGGVFYLPQHRHLV